MIIAAQGPFESAIILFIRGFWVPFVLVMINAMLITWKDSRQTIWHIKNRRFILLAIDVPRDNEQSPKAVENIFTHLHGILPGHNTIYQEWWLGKTTDCVSVELVSIEGYVQFLVYAQVDYRDLIESAFYSQYPDAEITLVEDYVYGQNGEFKDLKFPNDKYELYGCELILTRPNCYPIRLHPDFEHSLSQEFKDPMAGLLETLNKMGPGEQVWFQIVITPEYDDVWQGGSDKEAMKIAGKKTGDSSNMIDKSIDSLISSLDSLGTAIFPFYGPSAEQEKENELPSLMLHLTHAEQKRIEGIQMKADKHGYWTKFRYLYIADKKIATKSKGLSPIMGAIKQFDSMNSNGFRVHRYTKTWGLYYLFVKQRIARRQNRFLAAFQDRSRSSGSNGIILNTEELATIYHFPTEVVKAPLVSRTQSKRSSAPITLPLQNAPKTMRGIPAVPKQDEEEQKPDNQDKTPPTTNQNDLPQNLPFV